VLLGHLSYERFSGRFLWQFGLVKTEAVVVFFVLSGFVIAYTLDSRRQSATGYAVARAGRIYSVALPAVLLTVALDAWGTTVNPAAYPPGLLTADTPLWLQIAASLLFVNELWFLALPIGSCVPYWSLGYEVWYYIIFGLAVFLPGRWRVVGAGAAMLIAGPGILSMFPLWLLGVGLYRFSRKIVLSRTTGALLWAGTIVAWLAYELITLRTGRLTGDFGLTGGRLSLPENYLVGALFAAHLAGFPAISSWFAPVLTRFAKPIQWTAGATFSVYLIHYPVAQLINALDPSPVGTLTSRVLLYGGTLTAAFLFAAVTERRKDIWRRAFEWLLRTAPARPAKP
jgi:peptidoglycan/LPS O-acetylase OafA/YrhL